MRIKRVKFKLQNLIDKINCNFVTRFSSNLVN